MRTEHALPPRRARTLAAAGALTVLLALGGAGCGADGSSTVQAASNGASAASVAPPQTPVAAADQFMAAWRSGQLEASGSLATKQALDDATRASVDVSSVAGRGCARPDQVPGDDPPEATMVCVYVLPFNHGEVHVGVAPSGSAWQVVGVAVT